ncbi:hypothetical protein [Streptomyces sp. Ru87]|uniref:hypothetical protein n=1 Tax=Streptomyces sp. Ru87 TaxID=2044307 RepID=UPI00117F6112|nr:hypothetical protein [Streptomyces sp. Ru87]
MTGSTAAPARLCVVVLALACVLLGCAAESGPARPSPPSEGGDGKPGDGRTPCPRSQAPEQPSDGGSPGTTGPADSPEPSSGTPGDSTSHTLPPGDGCVIESGIPAMPVDP